MIKCNSCDGGAVSKIHEELDDGRSVNRRLCRAHFERWLKTHEKVCSGCTLTITVLRDTVTGKLAELDA